jgi:hypothetical protein
MKNVSSDSNTAANGTEDADMTALYAYAQTIGVYGICRFPVELDKEVFTPMFFPKGMKCKLIFSGIVHAYYSWLGNNGTTRGLDALYLERDSGNFMDRHDSLMIDMKKFRSEPLEEDRAEHQYILPYTGTGKRLALLLRSPEAWNDSDYNKAKRQISGSIEVTVASLTAAELAAIGLGAEKEETEEERQDYVRRWAISLATKAHLESNFLDPEYRQQYATKHLSRILSQEKEDWLDFYQRMFCNTDLYTLIVKEHPHVLDYFEGLFETVRIAERLAVAPPEPIKKPKLTREQWQARIERFRQRQVTRQIVAADDRIAELLARFESVQRLRERAEELGLRQDDIEKMEDQLKKDLDDEDEDNGQEYSQV